jgi:SLT domain-containing protein
VRIRITRRPEGEIDGVPLHRFLQGNVYDVNVSIGTYLMVSGFAQAVADTAPAKVVPLDFTRERRRGMNQVTQKAADRPRKKR